MSASASSPPAGEEKPEAAPVRHCKGVNDLHKVVLREVRGSSAEVSIPPLPASLQVAPAKRSGCQIDPGADPWLLPWPMMLLKAGIFGVAAPLAY